MTDLQKYQRARNTRRSARTHVGRFKAGKLAPVFAEVVRGNEGGMISQEITYELDPIAGRMITQITGHFVSLFVPVQAIDAIKAPDADYAGMTEVIRTKLLSGAPLFGLETEGEISKRCGVNPVSIGGVKKVSEMVRLAHNCAVNFLRKRVYHKATVLLHSSTAITPCIIRKTALDLMQGVLDPDDRINGAVQLDIPNMQLPVQGIGVVGAAPLTTASPSLRDTANPGGRTIAKHFAGTVYTVEATGTDSNNSVPAIYARLNGAAAGDVSLVDFYKAENRDRLVREMDDIIKNNRQYGEDIIMSWAAGINVDTGMIPFVISEQEQVFGRTIKTADDTEGLESDAMRTDAVLRLRYTVPVPKTELGGVIITFASVKPEEVILSQPHPILSQPWGVDNFVADELALDPVPVTVRELYSDCNPANEAIVPMYVGYNSLKRNYVSYGLNRQVNPTTVENKTAVWTYQLPLSVTNGNILYPEDLSQWPFMDQLAEVCSYSITGTLVVDTPMQFGPTPVETIGAIDAEDIFGEDE